MPQKNKVKIYMENGFYHVYNRGVEKRKIFLDDQDYRVFLYLLKYYLSPEEKNPTHPLIDVPNHGLVRPRLLTNLANEVDLLAYCLMPNHFHLLIKQVTAAGMTKLMRKLATSYVLYFNRRYNRVGHLFQGPYKAALIDDEAYILHVSRYIHSNPLELTRTVLVNYQYSSYPYYLGLKQAPWIKTEFILYYFKSAKLLPFLSEYNSYKKFVEGYWQEPRETVGMLSLD